jgi:hypothetical protein
MVVATPVALRACTGIGCKTLLLHSGLAGWSDDASGT